MKKNIRALPPKTSKLLVKIGHKEFFIKIVRNSWICRLFSKHAVLVLGNTVYVRDKVMVRKVLFTSLFMLQKQAKIGKLKYLWTQVVKGKLDY